MEMSRIERSLTKLETRLRAMIEGDASRDGISRKFHNQLLLALTVALRAEVKKKSTEDGQVPIPPDQFTLVLPIEQAHLLLTHPAALDRLCRKLERYAIQHGTPFSNPPMLRIVADPNAQELQILPVDSQDSTGGTLTIEMDGGYESAGSSAPRVLPNAFLIVNGLSTFRLNQTVLNIGRDPGNHLILENPRVSRSHAQIRFTAGHFTIFDLDSREGTTVNGVVVTSHLLNPGDVILLAGVPIVYGEESDPQVGYTQELPAEPPAPEVM